jgi:ABC-2 type transport system ATP-binding protein
MIEVRELTKIYSQTPVINNVSFTVKPGEILGYLGPEGSGKSTTLKILAGILEPTSGQIFYFRKNIREDINEYKSRIGYVPEQGDIFPHLSAFEYLQVVGRLYLIPDNILQEKISGLMEKFQLADQMHNTLSTFSRGMIQKVLISAALIHNPDFLILDEPLTEIDVASALILQDLLKKLAESGKKIICASQILEVMERICNRVIIIDKGIQVSSNSINDLRNLMDLPLLESILKKMIQKKEVEKSANDIISLMQM